MSAGKKLNEVIVNELDYLCQSEKAKIGLIIRRNTALAKKLIESGRNVIVLGDRFRPLYRLGSSTGYRRNVLVAEVESASLPVSHASLDALIFEKQFDFNKPFPAQLIDLISMVKPGGWIFWTFPTGGRVLKPGRKSFRNCKRFELCHLAMQTGLVEVGQRTLKRKRVSKKVLTFGKVPGTFFDCV